MLRELDVAARRPLTVVTAPAGYGKTTALAQWLQRAAIRHAWVALEAHDNDPRRLAARILAALTRTLPGRFATAERALGAGADLGIVVAMIAGALAGERVALVLDDFHLISAPEGHRLVSGLADAAPAGLSVLVATRRPAPLHLSDGRPAELGPEQLRFDRHETERLLNGALGLDLARPEIERIEAGVGGWAVGLALIGSALDRQRDRTELLHALARSRSQLVAYLTEEVLDGARPALQDFLRRTSILDRLSAPLCEAVLEDPRAGELLAEAWRMNLFVIPFEGDWLRYHPVFAETLAGELRRREPQLVGELHRRASAWFERAGMPEQAMEHALLAGDGPRAAALLADSWASLFEERRHATVRRVLDRLPGDRGECGPLCEALDLQCMVYEGVDHRLVAQRAAVLAAEHGDDPAVRLLVDGMLMSPLYGDIARAVEIGRAAWERYASAEDVRFELAPAYGAVLWWAGEHEAARRLLEPYLEAEQPMLLEVGTLRVLAVAVADAGELELAERYARAAVARVEEAGAQTAPEFSSVPRALADVLRRRGKLDEARTHVTRTLELEGRRPGSVGHAFALVLDAELAAAAGDRRRAEASARRARGIVDRYPDMGVLAARLRGVESTLEQPPDNPLIGTRPTRAELRVLALLDSELTFDEIAEELFVSRETVKSHARRLYRRLGVGTREEAARVARERGFV